MRFISSTLLFLLLSVALFSQVKPTVDYNNPKTYIIGGVHVSGIKYLSKEQIISLTGLREGDEVTVPGETFSTMVKRLMMQRYLSDVGVYIDSVVPTGDTCYFEVRLKERPRVSQWNFAGIKKSEKTDLMERVKLRRGGALSDYIASSSMEIIKRYYHEKGFLKADVSISQEIDTVIKNAVRVTFNINKGPKVKIKTITFAGNDNVKEGKLVKSMKKTRDMRITNFLKSKKFNEKEYETDKQSMISVFNEAGYRDAKILKDSIYYITPDRLGIDFVVDEGKRYYFRDISWTGNSVYTTDQLNSVLRIGKGDVYDVVTMDKRLNGDPKQQQPDVKKMYTDNGYLFFNVVPVEMKIDGDSVDVQMRIFEGEQATFNNIIINGNTITNEKIARRAVFTRPGYLFSQTDLERSIRELSSIGHFDPEKFQSPDGFSVLPNQVNNTVDIAYNLEEKANSQLELSGGWGGNMFVGTVGVSFNNFSLKRVFDKKAWRPVRSVTARRSH